MHTNKDRIKEIRKKPLMTIKEKRALKKLKKETKKISDTFNQQKTGAN